MALSDAVALDAEALIADIELVVDPLPDWATRLSACIGAVMRCRGDLAHWDEAKDVWVMPRTNTGGMRPYPCPPDYVEKIVAICREQAKKALAQAEDDLRACAAGKG